MNRDNLLRFQYFIILKTVNLLHMLAVNILSKMKTRTLKGDIN